MLLTDFTPGMQMPCITAPSTSLPKIPKATSTIPQLEAFGSSPTIVPNLSKACLKAARELRDACESSLRNAIQKGLAGPDVLYEDAHTSDAWNIVHSHQTRLWAEAAFGQARNIAAKTKSTAVGPTVENKKSVFNHEYTPLLEKYFEYNAYPSAVDRRVLARKSMMTPRQIEVWFQNHRNRAKKDGKTLRKLTEDPLPFQISLKSLERKMSFFTIPEDERKPAIQQGSPKDDSSDEEDTPSTSRPPLNLTSEMALSPPQPLHAFPTVYPPRCGYDPFPIKAGAYKFPPPTWFRKPATSTRTSKTAVNMDDFIADFDTKLHLRAPISKKRRSKLSQSWCASRATVLPHAPHPALVRTGISFPTTHIPRFPTVAAPYSRAHPFQSPSPFSNLTTLIPPLNLCNTPVRRKVARLPKRIPKSTSIAHHHGSSAISEASPASSRSSSDASRSTSFSSESTDRRPSSSSSTSSSSSSSLTTPELSHATLPDDGRSPSVSVSGIDFNNVGDLFGNSRSPSPEGGMPYTFSLAAQPKNPFTFGFEVPSVTRLQYGDSPFRSCAQVS